MLGQLNLDGKDKVEVAIELLQYFEPKNFFTGEIEGYYLAFSGGKDSLVCYHLLKMAGVKFDTNYALTSVDPPELVQFIKKEFSDCIIHRPKLSMWRLIEEKLMPPTRIVRYCCQELKEEGGIGRTVVTGVRWAESAKRKNTRTEIEFDTFGSKSKKATEKKQIFLMSDNEEKRTMFESCKIKGKHIINPIVAWSDADVWEFIRKYNIKYCSLYNEGWQRIGCIGCPMGNLKQKEMQFKRYPLYKRHYIQAFDKMLINRKEKELKTEWKTGQEVFNWWLQNKK